MPEANPVTMLVSYYPKAGKANDLVRLLTQHWPTLHGLGLVVGEARLWQATDKRTGREFFVELLNWRNENASDLAHQTPEVMAVWETMGPLLEDMQLTRLTPIGGPRGIA